ncbi:hypothetical protein MHYP_G00249790 [Metynnis hypsauchen]
MNVQENLDVNSHLKNCLLTPLESDTTFMISSKLRAVSEVPGDRVQLKQCGQCGRFAAVFVAVVKRRVVQLQSRTECNGQYVRAAPDVVIVNTAIVVDDKMVLDVMVVPDAVVMPRWACGIRCDDATQCTIITGRLDVLGVILVSVVHSVHPLRCSELKGHSVSYIKLTMSTISSLCLPP